jgi:hypothetical protein
MAVPANSLAGGSTPREMKRPAKPMPISLLLLASGMPARPAHAPAAYRPPPQEVLSIDHIFAPSHSFCRSA